MSVVGGGGVKYDQAREFAFIDENLKALAANEVYVSPEEIRKVDSAHQYRANYGHPQASTHFHFKTPEVPPPQQTSFQFNEKDFRKHLRNVNTYQQTTEPFRDRQMMRETQEPNRIYDLSTDIHSDVQRDLQHSNRHAKDMKRAFLNDRIRKFSTVNESADLIRSDDNDSVYAQKEFNYWTKLQRAKEKEAEATLKSMMTFCAGSAENLVDLFDVKGIKLHGLTKRVKRAFKKGRFRPALDQLQVLLNKYLDNPVLSSAVTLSNIIFKTSSSNRKKHLKAKLTGQEYVSSSSSDTDSSSEEEKEVHEKPTRKKTRSKTRSRTKSRSIEFNNSDRDDDDADADESNASEDETCHKQDKLDTVLNAVMDKMEVISKRLERLEKTQTQDQGFKREIVHDKVYDIECKGTYVPEEKSVAINLLGKVPNVASTVAEVHEAQQEVEKAKREVEKLGDPPEMEYNNLWKNVKISN
jgi:hypothetical protein